MQTTWKSFPKFIVIMKCIFTQPLPSLSLLLVIASCRPLHDQTLNWCFGQCALAGLGDHSPHHVTFITCPAVATEATQLPFYSDLSRFCQSIRLMSTYHQTTNHSDIASHWETKSFLEIKISWWEVVQVCCVTFSLLLINIES